jgi:hypothetical protein
MGLLDPAPETRLNAEQAQYLIDHAQRPPTGPQPVFHQQRMIQQPVSGTQPVHQPPSRGTHVLPSPKKGKKGILAAAAAVVLVAAVVAVLAVTGVFSSAKNNTASGGTQSSSAASSGTKPSSSPGPDATQYSTTKPLTYGPGGEVTSQEFLDNDGAGCFKGTGLAAMQPVDCADPHQLEVFDTINLDADYDSYPDMDAMTRTVVDGCKQKLSNFTPKYEVISGVMLPTQDAWAADKHSGLCIVLAPGSSQVTGSVAGN